MRVGLPFFAVWSVLAWSAVGQSWPGPEKLPEPDAAAVERSTRLVKDTFRAEFARQKKDDLRNLAVTLFQQGLATQDDDAAKFALYCQSMLLAAKAGDLPGAWCAVDQLSREFEAPRAPRMLQVLQAATSVPAGTALRALVVDASLAAADQAIAEDDLDSAQAILQLAESEAAKGKSPSQQSRVASRLRELDEVRDRAKECHDAIVRFDAFENQDAAGVVIGKYLCFVRGDWNRGLPLLAGGGLKPDATLPSEDLALPADAARQAELAARWWDLAQQQSGIERRRTLVRACRWYTAALMRLSGLPHTIAQSRMTEVVQEFPELALSSEVSLFAAYAGVWEINYTNSAKRYYCIDPRGWVHMVRDGSKMAAAGRLSLRDRKFDLSFGDKKKRLGGVERVEFAEGQLRIEHFNPPGKFSCTGLGTPHLLPESRPGTNYSDDFSQFAGIWSVRYGNGAVRCYMIGPAGSIAGFDEGTYYEGRMSKVNDDFLIDVGDNKLDRVKLHGMALAIEHFNPASTYPSSPAATSGVGISVWR